jgi:vacuolar-type H+-ATPase subunit H
MAQGTVARLLDIEKAAAKLHSDAQQQAADLIAEADKSALNLQRRGLEQARKEADHIIAMGKQRAEAEYAQTVAQAGADIQRLDTIAAKNINHAVDFVLTFVIGQN